MASVLPEVTSWITHFFREKRIPLLCPDATLDLGIRMLYPSSSSLGADRLANIIATHYFYGFPAIVVAFGTAITLDVLDEEGAYLGGVIAPGLNMAAEALHQKTALLPQTHPTPIEYALGQNTQEAIHAGILLGARGLLREVLSRVRKENLHHKKPLLLATGGDAELVAHGEELFDYLDPTLTLQGLRKIGTLCPPDYSTQHHVEAS